MIKVFGHLSPDTDCVGSAILWSWYLNFRGQEASPFVLGPLNNETAHVLKALGVAGPARLGLAAGDKVAVVDTNNPKELPANIGEAKLTSLVDHHLFAGGLTTKEPIEVTVRPVASSATVILGIMGADAGKLPKELCGLAMACIVSDTLLFRSPTTTKADRDAAAAMAARAGLDMAAFADGMFAAKSDVSALSDRDLVFLDSKEYPVGDKNVRVSVVETTDPSGIVARRAGIVDAMRASCADGKADAVLFFAVDILREEATVFAYDELTAGIVSASFGKDAPSGTALLPGVVSRKKQIVPALKLA